jgi:sugar phosphate isomerase/epimerase
MLVGAMNFPGRSVLKEIHRIAEDRFDFVDLTLEPPAAWLPNGKEVGSLISDLGLQVVGHTAWYLPIASLFPELRRQAIDLYIRGLDVFAEAGATLVNIHPDQRVPLTSPEKVRELNAEAIAEIVDAAAQRGIKIMVENLDRMFSGVEDIGAILEAVPQAGFHLDVGHANLRFGNRGRNRTVELLEAFSGRLVHVHVSDNRGGEDDLHLPLGAGLIDWKGAIRALKGAGYDGTVTLEVFSREREHLRTSRRLWLEWWSEVK